MPLRLAALVSTIAFAWAFPANAAELPPVHIDVSEGAPPFVSAYHLFKDARRQIPNDGLVPYELNTPHFADYATLHRFVWLPPGKSIVYQEDDTLAYPRGAAIILTLGFPYDLGDPAQGERLIETRLLVYTSSGWASFQYQWDETATDARLALAGGKVSITQTRDDGSAHNMDVLIPNRSQCSMCHAINDEFVPLGPMKAHNLNREYPYATGAENQLAHLQRIGYLRDLPEDSGSIPALPVWDDPATGAVNARARAYLDMNCSSCHQPGGLAYTSGLDLRYTQDNPVRFGVYKAPVAAGRGVGKGRYGIEPGEPERSILYHRMASTDPGIRMPVVGRGVRHEEGLALIHAWIADMDYPAMRKAEEANGIVSSFTSQDAGNSPAK
jgi:uncharacterized repeat protein (TIGR03806 family)